MQDFLIQTVFMCLGGLLVIIWRAIRLVPSADFSLRFFLMDRKNYQRFGLLGAAFGVLQFLLVFEGGFIVEALKSVGFVIPVAASSVLGFVLTWGAFWVRDERL